MLRLVLRRLIQAVPVILAILCLNFALLKAAPGDAVDALLLETGGADAETQARLRAEWELDLSWPVQLGLYLGRVATLDLGRSVAFARPVLDVILERLPNTLLLMGAATGFAFAAGTALGAVAARRAGSPLDAGLIGVGLLLYAMPGFWVGLMLMIAFAVQLRWLPLGGIETIPPHAGWPRVLDIAEHLVLPVIALSLMYLVIYMRLMRTAMLEVAESDFVRTARAKGLPAGRVWRRHIARNAMLPAITMLGLQFGSLLGGSVVIESVFAIPGLGRLTYEAVTQRDLALLLGVVLFSALLVILVNLVVDLLYARLDPRLGRG